MDAKRVLFVSQVVLVYIVVIACILNLSINKGENERVWIVLLSSCMGYLLPSPKLKQQNGSK